MKDRKNVAAVIMAGGRSKRMRSSGNPLHKALLRIRGLTLLEWNVSALMSYGFTEFFVSISSHENELERYAERIVKPFVESEGGTLTVAAEEVPLGTAGALARIQTPNEHVLVTYADNVTLLDFGALADFHLGEGADATVATHTEHIPVPFGVIHSEHGMVTQYEEKPLHAVRICSGAYCISNRARRFVPAEAIDLPSLITRLMEAGYAVKTFEHSAPWVDVNDEGALKRARALVSEHFEKFSTYLSLGGRMVISP